jgi:predicted TIM-barrel fold metal-dependent hydrolase
MDRHGIARAAIVADAITPKRFGVHLAHRDYTADDADNMGVLKICRAAAERLVPIWMANPHRSVAAYRKHGADFGGMELSPATHGVPLADWTASKLVEVAAELGHPVYVTCLHRPGCTVEALLGLARRFSETTFILGGGGIVMVDHAGVAAIADQENIVLDGSACATPLLARALGELGVGRVAFASPGEEPSLTLAKFTAAFEAASLSESDRLDVLQYNSQRVMRSSSDASSMPAVPSGR